MFRITQCILDENKNKNKKKNKKDKDKNSGRSKNIKIKIITQGCSLNFSDSEVLKGILLEEGFEFTKNDQEADLILYNTCTVKGPTESSFRRKLKYYRKLKKPIIIAGCLTQAQKNYGLEEFKDCSIIGVNSLNKISHVVKETLEGKKIHVFETFNSERLKLPFFRERKFVEIIPINQGCLGNCSYCKTKQARGNLKSYPVNDVINRVRIAVNNGVKEIWLTSQDTGTYGRDIGTNLGKLLLKILEKPGNYRIRLGMSNPEYLLEQKDLVRALKDDRMFKFLHIPLQSGNDRILKLMNRNYDVATFVKTIEFFRREIPNITIATDIICGFPTETEEEFEDTLNLVRKMNFDVINISMFWPRKGTVAEKLKQIPSRISKERSRKLTKLFIESVKLKNQEWVGWNGKVLITEEGKNETLIGRNDYYKQIILRANPDFEIGDFVDVSIKSGHVYDLRTF